MVTAWGRVVTFCAGAPVRRCAGAPVRRSAGSVSGGLAAGLTGRRAGDGWGTACHVPEPYRSVIAAGGEQGAVGGERAGCAPLRATRSATHQRSAERSLPASGAALLCGGDQRREHGRRPAPGARAATSAGSTGGDLDPGAVPPGLRPATACHIFPFSAFIGGNFDSGGAVGIVAVERVCAGEAVVGFMPGRVDPTQFLADRLPEAGTEVCGYREDGFVHTAPQAVVVVVFLCDGD